MRPKYKEDFVLVLGETALVLADDQNGGLSVGLINQNPAPGALNDVQVTLSEAEAVATYRWLSSAVRCIW